MGKDADAEADPVMPLRDPGMRPRRDWRQGGTVTADFVLEASVTSLLSGLERVEDRLEKLERRMSEVEDVALLARQRRRMDDAFSISCFEI